MKEKWVAFINKCIDMQNRYFVFTLLVCILFFQCSRFNKITCNIPADYPEARRQQIIGLFDKGKVLYKINCSQCHGIFTKGEDKVPNFTTTQIDNYSASFLRRDPKNHAIVAQMSQEQMGEILTFLRYKKINITDSTHVVK
jgi:mono/diheme cytochrome c family protein